MHVDREDDRYYTTSLIHPTVWDLVDHHPVITLLTPELAIYYAEVLNRRWRAGHIK